MSTVTDENLNAAHDSKARKLQKELLEEKEQGDDYPFDVGSTVKMDSREQQNSSFSSIHSWTSTASRRRNRTLRVKRYTKTGDEVSNETADPPESAPSYMRGVEGTTSASSFSSFNSSSRSFQGSASRMGRIKRYQSLELRPSTIESSGSGSESDEEGEDKGPETARYFPNKVAALHSTPNDNIHTTTGTVDRQEDDVSNMVENGRAESEVRSYVGYDGHFETETSQKAEQLHEGEDSKPKTSNISTSGTYQAHGGYRAHVERVLTEIDGDKSTSSDASCVEAPREDDGAPDVSSLSREISSTSARNRGLAVSVRMDENDGTDSEPEEDDVVASSRRARESITKRQAAAVATAAAAAMQYKSRSSLDGDSVDSVSRTPRVQLSTPPTSKRGADRRVGTIQEDEKEKRKRRIEELEERKRKLEDLAKSASLRRDPHSSVRISAKSSSLRKTSERNADRPRTLNIDVYTGEVIGEMPKASTLVKEGTKDDFADDSSSDNSSTEYDLPVARRHRQKRMLLIAFFLISIGLGVYFGVFFEMTESNDRRAIPLIAETPAPTPAPSATSSPSLSAQPNPSLRLTVQPSLRPSQSHASPLLPESSSEPTNLPFPIFPSESTPVTTISTLLPSIDPIEGTIGPSIVSTLDENALNMPSNDPINMVSINPTGGDFNGPTIDQENNSTGSNIPSQTPLPQNLPLLDSVDSELYQFLLQEWPPLSESLEAGSPQLRAIEWLSADPTLALYSTARRNQRFALATFFFSTSGETWLRNEFWLTDENECQWFTSGSATVQCDANGMYSNLELNFNDLDGTLPGELALLSSSLSSINLIGISENGSIRGTIPTELGLLTEVEFINLRGNELQGPIPTEIGNWSNLRILNLCENILSGSLPPEIGLLTKLILIDLEENVFAGELPSEMGRLTFMESLLLSNNQFTGAIPANLGLLTSMKTLSANSNGFITLPTEIGNLASLSTLAIANNRLSGELPSEIGQLSSLLRIDLSRNFLSGTIPTNIGDLGLIRDTLDFSKNRLTGTIPVELGRLLLLRELLLHSNQLAGELPTSFRSLGRLNMLRIESNRISGSVPASVCALFNNSFPIFVSDCFVDLECSCCSYCCAEDGDCLCQFENADGLQFLCNGYP